MSELAPLHWDKARHSVNISWIDEEHKQLFSLINRIRAFLNSSPEDIKLSIEIISSLNEMAQYAFLHFKNEETFLLQHDFPELDAHIHEHKIFREKIASFDGALSENPVILINDVLIFLQQWLDHHVYGTDRKYAEYLKNII